MSDEKITQKPVTDDDSEMPCLLFVDDEKPILKSLRRLFAFEKWKMYFASSAAEGLEILAQFPVDLVVSDVRMPVMDGIAFLSEVKKRYPKTIRIFLSGYADKKAVLRAFIEGSVQQFIAKPWENDELSMTIKHVLKQAAQQKQKEKGLQEFINSFKSIPPMPKTYFEVKKYLSDPKHFPLDKVKEFVEKDISLTADLIRWANSAFFAQRCPVESVKRALVVLGSDIVEGIILSNSVFNALETQSRPVPGFSREAFYNHSLSCAMIAKRLIQHSKFNNSTLSDQAFTAGLLHDIGKLVEWRFMSEKFEQALELAHEEGQDFSCAELQVIGTSHGEIGGYLAEWWSLPTFLINAIRSHHTPPFRNADKEVVAAVHVADILSHQFKLGDVRTSLPLNVDMESWALFDLSKIQLQSLKEEAAQVSI